jgi:MFS family permease
VLVGLTLVLEMFSLLGQTPRAAMVPRLVRPENLVTANSLMLGAAYGTVVMGPLLLLILAGFPGVSLGGLIPVGNEGLAVAFAVDALTFFASGLLVATLPKIESPLVADQPNNGVDLKSTWRDFAYGIKFFATDKSIRRVIVGMTTALFGGGTVIVLGPEFAQNVLQADDAGFYAIVTMLGLGALAGLVLASLNEDRIVHRDLAFGLATSTAGISLSAAAMVTTVAGAAAWMTAMGFGAGAAYLMGLTHLHEYVDDELRGRVLATLFALMRIGLFVAMALAVPLVDVFRGIDIGRLNDPTRVVLFLGGLTMLIAGLGVLWALRSTIRAPSLGLEARDIIAAANRARRRQSPSRRKHEKEES